MCRCANMQARNGRGRGTGIHVPARLDQQRHGVRVVLVGCPHQGRFTQPGLPGVDIGTVDEQRLIMPTLPVRAAVMSTVSPSGWAVFAFAPASSASITAALPLVAASERASRQTGWPR